MSLSVIFDQYSRYKACADFLYQAGLVAGDTVLDVGSGPECLFGQFVPNASMTYIDPLISAISADRITGNIFSSQLDGRSFDCVTAVDVFEHVSPREREAFLYRLSALGRRTLILGFPTSDSSDAMATDKTIEEFYGAIFGRDYPWLEEHHRHGLPSLASTLKQLADLGWHCQTIGHGHAPWLQQLLTFAICVWDIPALRGLVLHISEKFNRDLYPYDFRPPHYRQFLIASRSALPTITPPSGSDDTDAAESRFQTLIRDAYREFFSASMRLLIATDGVILQSDKTAAEHDSQIACLTQSLAHRDAEIAGLSAALRERDSRLSFALAEHAATTELLEIMRRSRSWRLTRPLRVFARTVRHGVLAEDRRRLIERLRVLYHRLPLPQFAKRGLRWSYYKVLGDPFSRVRRQILSATTFRHPSLKAAVQEIGVPDYVVWGVIDWHFRYQRPQQMARALAARGRRVFYVSVHLVDDPRGGFDAEPLSADGRLFQIKLYAMGAPVIYSSAPGVETVVQLRRSIGEVLDWANCRSLISLVQHPFWYDIAAVLPNSRVVYDCMDHHQGFDNNSAAILLLERRLLLNADLTVTTSDWLDKMVAPQTARHVVIRNAGEFEHFAHKPATTYRDPRGRRIIGYYGAIASWFDQDLVAAVAEQFSKCLVLLVGADTIDAKARLGKFPNVKFIGEVHYSELPYYLHSFDVCMLPFKLIPLTLATNPVKVYEYLSAGKPVVTVDLPEMKQFGNLVQVGKSAEDFLSAIADALKDPEATLEVNRRQTFAREQTWTNRANALIDYAESTGADPKVSVVVVTFNNLELTRVCLASLDEFSDYGRLEIIVVDNASTDGSEKFLSDWVSATRDRHLILNRENRGFAAANNQGLAIATGDYLALLNNDTHVTPGWCRTLTKHLQRDPSIGLIGPVTNNIGNEAKINISYTSMEDMLQRSASFTRSHIGRTFPLHTAAFFCVMMPREVYERTGPLDESFGRGFFEDDDYCRRIEQLGLRVVCAEDVFIHHHLSASFSKLRREERQALFEHNRAIYEAKWGKWVPHTYRTKDSDASSEILQSVKYVAGQCNVCGNDSRFFYTDVTLWRESLTCEYCQTTSRYRSIARGILRAIDELTGINSRDLTALPSKDVPHKLRIYDTQPPFYYDTCAYPLPDLLKRTGWIDVELSQYRPNKPRGEILAEGITNQNLECLTFANESLDIVITSDVMEHVRLDDLAHSEIYRVLKPGGIYVFTVPHNRAWDETLVRVQITDPDDSTKDVHLLEPEYHGDANAVEDGMVLAYRAYGKDMELFLTKLGFEVEYSCDNIERLGILDTELYYCRKGIR